MNSYKLSKMKKGWFLGNLEPTALRWNKGEIAVKHFFKGKVATFANDGTGRFFLILLNGKCLVNSQTIESGQIVESDSCEALSVMVVEDCIFLEIIIFHKSKNTDANKLFELLLESHRKEFKHKDFESRNTPIEFGEITAVVQGAIDPFWTLICLKSIKFFLPGSKIIVSTWKDSKDNNLDCDVVLKNDDPGACCNGVYDRYDAGFANNVNRQLLSTRNGLECVNTEYALKIRSDMMLTTNEFIRFFEKYPHCDGYFRIFDHKVMISDLFTKETCESVADGECKYFPVPFHPSDWFFFGKTADLKKYFCDTPLMENDKGGNFRNYAHPERKVEYKSSWSMQYPPEQYLAISALRNNGFDISMSDWTDWNDEYIGQSRDFILNNFIVLSYANHGIFLPKYKNKILANSGVGEYEMKGLFTQQEYERAYKEKFGSLDD